MPLDMNEGLLNWQGSLFLIIQTHWTHSYISGNVVYNVSISYKRAEHLSELFKLLKQGEVPAAVTCPETIIDVH